MVKSNRQGRFYSRILQEGRQARTSLSSTPLGGMGGNAGEFSRTGMEKVNWPYSKNTGKEQLKDLHLKGAGKESTVTVFLR